MYTKNEDNQNIQEIDVEYERQLQQMIDDKNAAEEVVNNVYWIKMIQDMRAELYLRFQGTNVADVDALVRIRQENDVLSDMVHRMYRPIREYEHYNQVRDDIQY